MALVHDFEPPTPRADGCDDFQLSDDGGQTWRAVSKAEYVNAERGAGFRNTLGQPNEPGTSAWSSGDQAGRMYPLTKPRVETGDVTVIGTECFASADGSVICWRGQNYVPQSVAAQSDADHRTMDARATELERELKVHQQRHSLAMREISYVNGDDWSPEAKDVARAVRDSLLMGGCDDCPPDCRFCAVDPECGCDVHPAADAASQPAVQDRKLPVCADCGHRHRWGGECAGHAWSDSCPYDAGADCETAVDQSVSSSVVAVTQPAEETNNG